jgi:hypothetical protein
MGVPSVKRLYPRLLPREVGSFVPGVKPRVLGHPWRASCAIPQPEPELRLIPARIIRHAVDVRAQEGQEGDAEGLQIGHRVIIGDAPTFVTLRRRPGTPAPPLRSGRRV